MNYMSFMSRYESAAPMILLSGFYEECLQPYERDTRKDYKISAQYNIESKSRVNLLSKG
jgi:hypothetical protein